MIMKRRHNRNHIFPRFVLKNADIPLGKSGLKVIDWDTLNFIKGEVEKARKEVAATKQ